MISRSFLVLALAAGATAFVARPPAFGGNIVVKNAAVMMALSTPSSGAPPSGPATPNVSEMLKSGLAGAKTTAAEAARFAKEHDLAGKAKDAAAAAAAAATAAVQGVKAIEAEHHLTEKFSHGAKEAAARAAGAAGVAYEQFKATEQGAAVREAEEKVRLAEANARQEVEAAAAKVMAVADQHDLAKKSRAVAGAVGKATLAAMEGATALEQKHGVAGKIKDAAKRAAESP